MCLRKTNGAYVKKECAKQCDKCKVQEAMQQFLQASATGKAENTQTADNNRSRAFINPNQNIIPNYIAHS